MWKPLAISMLVGLGTSAIAHDGIEINTDNCNASLDYSVSVGPNFFEVKPESDDKQLVYFGLPDQLLVEGKPIVLGPQQMQLMQEYRKQLHSAGRDTLLITLEAVDIAMDGLSLAITTLAGPDHPDTHELKQFSAELLQRTEDRLNREGEIYQLGNSEIGDYVDETISAEFEPRIERLAKQSAGTIAWHALKAVFTGGQSIEEQVTEEVEQLLEQRASAIEYTAQKLCSSLESIEKLEIKIHKEIPALGSYDLVEIK
ncbi:DUF2884 family protein [Microbulbifer epialgicus]|uniref:DUF2884 family protein n=1 Tax=Microbulbifer epialgicus TaxID=393907 RepID=A0ABV4NUP8_9GAMM